MGWIKTSEKMPGDGDFVIAAFVNSHGKWRRIRAYYASRYGIQVDPCVEEEDCWEAGPDEDTYFVPEGWYECNEHEETHWAVYGDVRYWMPLPPLPEEPER